MARLANWWWNGIFCRKPTVCAGGEWRQKAVKRDHPHLGVRRQCTLLFVLSRSGLSYRPVGESADNPRFMEIIDKPFSGNALVWLATNGPP